MAEKRFITKNGLQTQNINFVSPNNSNSILAEMLDSDTIAFSGNSGQLFSITDSLTGTIFSVNDISGIPSIEVLDDGTIRLAQYAGNIGIGKATPTAKLDIADTTLAGSGSLTGSVLNLTQTWNTSGTPTAIKLNVTNTASGGVGRLLDLQVGGTSVFAMGRDGVLRNAGIAAAYADGVCITAQAASRCFAVGYLNGNNVQLGSTTSFGWTAGADSYAALETILVRDAAHTIAQRNGVNAQAFRLYNTYTDASNYERMSLGWSGNVFTIANEAAGTGGQRSITISGYTGVFINTIGETVFSANGGQSIIANAVPSLPRGAYITPLAAAYIGTILRGRASQTASLSVWQNSAGSYLFEIAAGGQLYNYNTYTDASNYERGKIAWESNVLRIGTEKLGTGTARQLDLQTDGTTRISIAGNGTISTNNAINVVNSAIVQIAQVAVAGSGTQYVFDAGTTAYSGTSGATTLFAARSGFTPTSGIMTYSGFAFLGTINQTGGANGITRGVYVNPTLTAAADWRSIETSNNTGWAIYAAGTANSYFGGGVRVVGAYYDSSNSAGSSGQVLASTGTGTDWVNLSEISGVDGSGTLNYITKWTPDGNTIGNSQLFDNGTNVGIGTASPSALFSVGASNNFTVDSSGNVNLVSPANIQVNRTNDVVGNPAINLANQFGLQITGTAGDFQINRRTGGTWYNAFTILNSNGNASFAASITVNASVTCYRVGTLDGIDADFRVGAYGARNIIFGSGASGTEYARINSSGNLGIGTASPSEKLHIEGSSARMLLDDTNQMVGDQETALLTLKHTVNNSEAPSGRFDDSFPHAGISFKRDWTTTESTLAKIQNYGESGWGGGLAFFTKDDDGSSSSSPLLTMDLTPDGNVLINRGSVGIGTTSPATLLHVLTATAEVDFLRLTASGQNLSLKYMATPNSFVFTSSSGRNINFNNSGNIGIGFDTAPTAKLDIADTTLAGSGSLAGSIVNLAQTWNTSGTPTAIKLNVTDTASNAASLLMDLQTGATSTFKVEKTGNLTIGTGGTTLTFSGNNDSSYNFSNGSARVRINASLAVSVFPALELSRSAGGTYDTSLRSEEAGGIIAQRNDLNPQVFRIYNTYTNASNYERGKFAWSSNVFQIGTEKLGTGTARALELQTDGTTRLNISATTPVIKIGNDANGCAIFSFSGSTYSTPANGTNLGFFSYDNGLNSFGIAFGADSVAPASGSGSHVLFARTFAPISGTATYSFLDVQSTVNQTGGANGITRGIYVRPTLTAAADWRSIETSNNNGWAIYTAGTANSYFGGNVGIGTTSPTAALQLQRPNGTATILQLDGDAGAADALVSSIKFRRFNYDSSGTAAEINVYRGGGSREGAIAFCTNPGTSGGQAATERMRIVNTGHVGIGTSSPEPYNLLSLGKTLHISETSGVEFPNVRLSTTNVETILAGSSGSSQLLSTRYWGVYVVSSDSGIIPVSAPEEVIRFLRGGLKIRNDLSLHWGSSTFASPDVYLYRDAAGVLAQRNGVNAQAFRVYNTYTDASNYELAKIAWNSNVLQIGTEKLGTGTARALELQTDGTTRVTVGTTGNVGIGTTSPSQKLQVLTDTNKSLYVRSVAHDTITNLSTGILFSRASDGAEVGGAIFGCFNGGLGLAAREGIVFATGGASTYQNTTERMRIDTSGNVGIGTASPSYRLHVAGGSMYLDTNYSFYVQDIRGTSGLYLNQGTSANIFLATGGGNVGINTASPGSTLDVKGTLRLSGSSSGYVGLAPAAAAGSTTYTLPSADGTNGQVLTTNGTGTLSWTSASGGVSYEDSIINALIFG